MESPVSELIAVLSSSTGITVEEAGRRMLELLSGGELSREAFLEAPHMLVRPEQRVPRYVAQVTWRAVRGDYTSVDEIVRNLSAVLDRKPPVLEPGSTSGQASRIVVPEARVLRTEPRLDSDGPGRKARFEAHVTSGRFRNQEITVEVASAVNPTACDTVSMFWIHSSVALYNLEQVAGTRFRANPGSFFVLEPLRQANASTVARSLSCPRPEIDRLRQGRGDMTVHMIRGLMVHSILDRLIAGEEDLVRCYRGVLTPYLVQLAALVDEAFDEDAFRAEVMNHATKLRELIADNPHMRRDPQFEVRRYSPTIGIQGRIDAVFRSGTNLDIVELKTGKRLRREDHAQVYIYRLLLSDFVRRARREDATEIGLTSRLISSWDGSSTPARPAAGFLDIVYARNHLVALTWTLGRSRPHVRMPYADYDSTVCGSCPSWTRSRCRKSSRILGDIPDSDESPELSYFRRFSRLIRRESWSHGEDLATLLDDSRIADRVRNFRTIRNVRCVGQEPGTFLFEFDENHSELTVGDRVLIHAGEISSRTSYHGYVRSVGPTRAGIAVPLQKLSPDVFHQDRAWLIDKLDTDLTSEASQTALHDFLTSGRDARTRVILGDVTSGGGTSATNETGGVDSGFLNDSQLAAVRRAVACSVFHLIWGPPGTGKTRIVPEIVSSVSGRVLLGAFTNTAVDKMLMSLLDRDPDARFLRIGRSESSPELAARLGSRARSCFSEDLAQSAASATELRSRLDAIPLVAATAHRASSHPYVRLGTFEMVVVDEAGQLTEPLSLGLIMRARRFVLIGDDRQLPPVVRTPELATSLFERLKAACQTSMPDAVTLLDVQYRMHPAIMAVPNKLYYDGQLSSGVGSGEREPPVGPPLVFVPIDAVPAGRSNAVEATAVGGIVRALLEHVPAEGIGVISPFRAQVALLRQELDSTGVTVDTVERYQGGEREVVVISFVKSRGTGFVFDDRRLNVAITRARRKLILVAHPELFSDTKFRWVSEYEVASTRESGG